MSPIKSQNFIEKSKFAKCIILFLLQVTAKSLDLVFECHYHCNVYWTKTIQKLFIQVIVNVIVFIVGLKSPEKALGKTEKQSWKTQDF